ncbi:MAG: RidA family protein, partial [Bacillota bacterium]|nr:RidA family protein [Bacillota bacterium]
PTPRGFYSQGVRADDMVYISGQLPLDHDGKLVGTSPEEQTRHTLSHVVSIVEAAGGNLCDLVQVTIYITDIEHWPAINTVYKEILGGVSVPPARAVVPVKELHYGALVEIQATAYIPKY